MTIRTWGITCTSPIYWWTSQTIKKNPPKPCNKTLKILLKTHTHIFVYLRRMRLFRKLTWNAKTKLRFIYPYSWGFSEKSELDVLHTSGSSLYHNLNNSKRKVNEGSTILLSVSKINKIIKEKRKWQIRNTILDKLHKILLTMLLTGIKWKTSSGISLLKLVEIS